MIKETLLIEVTRHSENNYTATVAGVEGADSEGQTLRDVLANVAEAVLIGGTTPSPELPAATSLQPVKSDLFTKIGYDPSKQLATVEFKTNGDIWAYSPVSAITYSDWMNAESIGSFFHRNIKPHCQAVKIGNVHDAQKQCAACFNWFASAEITRAPNPHDRMDLTPVNMCQGCRTVGVAAG